MRCTLLLITVSAVLVATSMAAHAHNNYISFYSDEGSFVHISYDLSSDSITPGQPFDGVSGANPNTLNVRAGRKTSGIPADSFNQGIKPGNALASNEVNPFGVPALPSGLNFAVFGNFSFQLMGKPFVTCPNLRLAQGHELGHNNWWIASQSCHRSPSGTNVTCGCCHSGNCGSLNVPVQFHSSGADDELYLHV